MAERTELRTIRAYAGAGALTTAWRLFRAGGYEADASGEALSTKGRLLKEQALATAPGPARRLLFLAAAEAYGGAGPGSSAYALINVATLWRLAGRAEEARRGAEAVLAQLDAGRDADTPYFLAATRAEALLVLGRTAEARAALEAAVAASPRAWTDHGPTLRQFRLILQAMKEPAGWLEALAPPRALHFAGHMGVGDDLAGEVRELLAREHVGFGYGALAAGADIVIAEALVAQGADLHVVLPASPDAFRAASVAPFGDRWARRFDALLERARSVRALRTPASAAHPLALQAASEIAMGKAVLQAHACAGEPLQLVVLDPKDTRRSRGSSPWAGAVWRRAGRRQAVITAARADEAPATPASRAGGGVDLVAFLAVRTPSLGDPAASRLMRAADRALSNGPRLLAPAVWSGRTLQTAYADPSAAAAAAAALSAVLGDAASLGAHYALSLAARGPEGNLRFLGEDAEAAPAIANRTPGGLVDVSDDFAAALVAYEPAARAVPVGGGVALGEGEEIGVYGLAV